MSQRILFLFNTGEIVGGGERSLLEFLQRLDQQTYEPWVVVPQEGTLTRELRKQGLDVRVVEMPTLKALPLLQLAGAVRRLCRFMREGRVVLVHANGSRCAFYGGIAARLAGVPLLWHVRIADPDPLLDWLLARLATRIVVVSRAVQRRMERIAAARKKIRLIYNGIDTEKFSPSASIGVLRSQYPNRTKFVGMVGRMDNYKDYPTFLDAAKLVLERFPQARFVVVGSGGKEKECRQKAHSLEIEEHVNFLGDREDVASVLRDLDVFALSSRSEGFGRAVAEAMAMEKPVAATRAGGVEEIVEDGVSGLLVPVGDAAALARCVIRLLQDGDFARELGLQARRRVQTQFSLDRHVRAMHELYREIVEGRQVA